MRDGENGEQRTKHILWKEKKAKAGIVAFQNVSDNILSQS